MFESKYSGFLTALLIIIIVGIIGVLGYLGVTFYLSYNTDKEAAEAVDAFIQEKDKNVSTGDEGDGLSIDDVNGIDSSSGSSESQTSGNTKNKLGGYNIIGTIEIPTTKVKYPILEKVTKSSIEIAIAMLYGPGPNKEGNTVLVGHNYRNGQFFSNNKKLSNGDKVYITDTEGNRVSYTIYDKFNTTPEDTSFYARNTNGAREITLSTCTDDSKERIIIFAKADED